MADDVLVIGKHREKLALLEAMGLKTALCPTTFPA
jgi:hypothetical protein